VHVRTCKERMRIFINDYFGGVKKKELLFYEMQNTGI
jgi:hypothetical protein